VHLLKMLGVESAHGLFFGISQSSTGLAQGAIRTPSLAVLAVFPVGASPFPTARTLLPRRRAWRRILAANPGAFESRESRNGLEEIWGARTPYVGEALLDTEIRHWVPHALTVPS
jgi:hypothetical protein